MWSFASHVARVKLFAARKMLMGSLSLVFVLQARRKSTGGKILGFFY